MPEGHPSSHALLHPLLSLQKSNCFVDNQCQIFGDMWFCGKGHWTSVCLKDSISRFPRMRGKRRMFVDGGKSNCAGLIDHMLINKCGRYQHILRPGLHVYIYCTNDSTNRCICDWSVREQTNALILNIMQRQKCRDFTTYF